MILSSLKYGLSSILNLCTNPPSRQNPKTQFTHKNQRYSTNHGRRRCRPTEPFPWRCGYDITPSERETTKLLNGTIVLFFLRLVLRRRPTYAATQKPTIALAMAAVDTPYDNLPMELGPQYCTDRAPITSKLHDNHQIIFPAAGSPSASHLRWSHTATATATDAPYPVY
jgi:hypothetical protein